VPGWRWETQNGAKVDSKGERILYTRAESGVSPVTVVREQIGSEVDLDLPLFDARWSPDDEFVVGTDLGTGAAEGDVLIWRFNIGPLVKLTKGYAPVWSRDGSRIYFLREGRVTDGAELWSITREGRDEKRIDELKPMSPIAHFYDVSPKGLVVYVQMRPGKQQLAILDLNRR
jgi:hypothetical protein